MYSTKIRHYTISDSKKKFGWYHAAQNSSLKPWVNNSGITSIANFFDGLSLPLHPKSPTFKALLFYAFHDRSFFNWKTGYLSRNIHIIRGKKLKKKQQKNTFYCIWKAENMHLITYFANMKNQATKVLGKVPTTFTFMATTEF